MVRALHTSFRSAFFANFVPGRPAAMTAARHEREQILVCVKIRCAWFQFQCVLWLALDFLFLVGLGGFSRGRACIRGHWKWTATAPGLVLTTPQLLGAF